VEKVDLAKLNAVLMQMDCPLQNGDGIPRGDYTKQRGEKKIFIRKEEVNH